MDRQKEIIDVFLKSDKEVLTKQEIIKLGNISYYYNTSFHAGNTLSRMVNNGLLERVKKGSYKLSGRQNKFFKSDVIANPNQTELF